MKPVPVYNEQLEFLGVMHNWQNSIIRGEMDEQELFSPGLASIESPKWKKCFSCPDFKSCMPKLLVALPK